MARQPGHPWKWDTGRRLPTETLTLSFVLSVREISMDGVVLLFLRAAACGVAAGYQWWHIAVGNTLNGGAVTVMLMPPQSHGRFQEPFWFL